MASNNNHNTINIKNRKATFDYEIIETFTAGIVLTGTEIKSIRQGKCGLTDTYCMVINGEIWVKSMYIAEYSYGSYNNHSTHRDRKLLLNRKEIRRIARDTQEPVLVHVMTRKGKGCEYAERHPEIYHGVGPFNVRTGELPASSESFSDRFGKKLCELTEEHHELVAITAAMSSGTGLDHFARRYPERFYDVGIAEGHAVSMAGGMAKQGLLPVFAVYSSFLQRGFDMMIHDVSLLGLHVVFCVDRAGIVGSDGETHHGIFDVSYLRTVPGMKIFCPASFSELDSMLEFAVEKCDGPVAIRYPRGCEGNYRELHLEPESVLQEGCDLTIVAYGTMINEVLEAAEILRQHDIQAEVIKLAEIGGDDYPLVMDSIRRTGRLLVAEEVCSSGSIGSVLSAEASQKGLSFNGVFLNLGQGIVSHGTRNQLMHDNKIDSAAIAGYARQLCGVETDV